MLACPRCARQLRISRYGRAAAYQCPGCTGHAITYPVVREALERARWRRLWLRVVSGKEGAGVKCPGCGNAMAEVRDGDLVVDSCRGCQMLWFDRDELGTLPARKVERRAPTAAEQEAAVERVRQQAAPAERGPPDQTWQRICGWLGLPFELDSPVARRAWVTAGVAIALLAVHFVAVISGLGRVVEGWGFIPDRMWRHDGATWITSFFLHGGWLHLFGNAYFLVAFGDNVEEDLGAARYALLLLVGTVLGCALHASLDPRSDVPLVGASAGISAVLLYYAFRFPKARIGWALRYAIIPIWWFRMTARTAFLLWLVLQLFIATLQSKGLTNVSAMGHLGGVLAGVLFVVAQRTAAAGDHGPRPGPRRPPPRLPRRAHRE